MAQKPAKIHNQYHLSSLARALKVLQLIGDRPQGVTLTDLVKQLGSSNSVMIRILSTFAEFDFVRRSESTKSYKLGRGVEVLGRQALGTRDLLGSARSHLSELADKFPGVAYLTTVSDSSVVVLDRFPRVGHVGTIPFGETMPLHACASGLVFLAFGGAYLREKAINAGLARYGPETPTDLESLDSILAQVRKNGFSSDLGILQEDRGSYAVPIYDESGAVVAALSMTFAEELCESALEYSVVSSLIARSVQIQNAH